MHNAQRRQGTIGASPRRPLTPPKNKPWSHQDDLLALRGKEVRVEFRDSATLDVTLLEADQFAIKLRLHDGQSNLIVWKHDLSSIRALPVID